MLFLYLFAFAALAFLFVESFCFLQILVDPVFVCYGRYDAMGYPWF